MYVFNSPVSKKTDISKKYNALHIGYFGSCAQSWPWRPRAARRRAAVEIANIGVQCGRQVKQESVLSEGSNDSAQNWPGRLWADRRSSPRKKVYT